MVLSVLQATGASLNKLWTGLINLIRRLKSFLEGRYSTESLEQWAETTLCKSTMLYWQAFFQRINKLKDENMNNVDLNTTLPPLYHNFMPIGFCAVHRTLLLVACSWICVCTGGEMIQQIRLFLRVNAVGFVYNVVLIFAVIPFGYHNIFLTSLNADMWVCRDSTQL